MYFSFHGIVGVEVEDSYPWFDTLFIKPLPVYADEEEFARCKRFIKVRYQYKLKPVLAVNIGQGMQLDGRLLIDTNYGINLHWEDEKTIVLQTARECNEWLMICLQVMLLAEGYSFIHGAGFSRDGKGLLVASRSGMGKTGCVAGMVKEGGWQLLGDDFVIINSQGKVLSFLKDFVIYPFHQSVFPDLFASGQGPAVPLAWNAFFKRLILRIKPILSKYPALFAMARKYNPQSKKISPKQIFSADKLADSAVISEVIWLERKQLEQEGFVEAAAGEIASRAAAITLLEILTDRCQAVLAVCGMGKAFMDYDQLFQQTRNIFVDAFSQARVHELNVRVSAEFKDISDLLIAQTQNDRTGKNF